MSISTVFLISPSFIKDIVRETKYVFFSNKTSEKSLRGVSRDLCTFCLRFISFHLNTV